MKYSSDTFSIQPKYAMELREKRSIFKEITGVRDSVQLTLVTPIGLRHNAGAEVINQTITLLDLMK